MSSFDDKLKLIREVAEKYGPMAAKQLSGPSPRQGIQYKLPEEMSGEDSLKMLGDVAAPVMDVIERPSAAIRGGLYGAMKDDDTALEGALRGLTNPSAEAPSGDDIAALAGEKYNIQNPAILAGLSTAATMADIPNPLSAASKLKRFGKLANIADGGIKETGKIKRGISQVGNIKFPSQGTKKDLLVKKMLEKREMVGPGRSLRTAESSVDFGTPKHLQSDAPMTLVTDKNFKKPELPDSLNPKMDEQSIIEEITKNLPNKRFGKL